MNEPLNRWWSSGSLSLRARAGRGGERRGAAASSPLSPSNTNRTRAFTPPQQQQQQPNGPEVRARPGHGPPARRPAAPRAAAHQVPGRRARLGGRLRHLRDGQHAGGLGSGERGRTRSRLVLGGIRRRRESERGARAKRRRRRPPTPAAAAADAHACPLFPEKNNNRSSPPSLALTSPRMLGPLPPSQPRAPSDATMLLPPLRARAAAARPAQAAAPRTAAPKSSRASCARLRSRPSSPRL
jgi:hypothetical protein